MVYYRLIALWVLCETMLGGLFHGVKIPGMGLFLGSCAVICISLLAYYVPARGSILKATVVVAIFKMMLSPQAPPTAYIAVFFQGLLGEALFWSRKNYLLSCLLFGIVVMVESGLQRIIVLTIVYGRDLWEVIDTFINGVTGQTTFTNYSFLFILCYIFMHVMVGAVVGLWVGKLPKRIHFWTYLHKEYLLTNDSKEHPEAGIETSSNRKRKFQNGAMCIWIVCFLLYAQSSLNIGPALLPASVYIKIFIRSFLIIMMSYFFLGPCLKWFLNRWLQKRKVSENEMVEKIIQYLPEMKHLVRKSWQITATKTGGRRILLCGKIVLLNILCSVNE